MSLIWDKPQDITDMPVGTLLVNIWVGPEIGEKELEIAVTDPHGRPVCLLDSEGFETCDRWPEQPYFDWHATPGTDLHDELSALLVAYQLTGDHPTVVQSVLGLAQVCDIMSQRRIT